MLEQIVDELNDLDSPFRFDTARDDIVVTLDSETIGTITVVDEGRGALVAFVDGLAPTLAAQLTLTIDHSLEVTLDDEPVLAVSIDDFDDYRDEDNRGLDD